MSSQGASPLHAPQKTDDAEVSAIESLSAEPASQVVLTEPHEPVEAANEIARDPASVIDMLAPQASTGAVEEVVLGSQPASDDTVQVRD